MKKYNPSIPFAPEELTLDRMAEHEIDEAASFVGRTMDPDEGDFARKTMRFHFQCRKQALDDGRDYYVWHTNGKIAGLVGLHHYIWGPEENVWLGWFALDRAYRRKGAGRRLISEISAIAVKKGYSKLYVETYSSATFADA
ncbi:MAG: GNAT family N-acetyltransferase, partial [Verrucomicrobia bacterium]|nr:GNAT family N-acetyltransferase [Verrucomicrobiota bacterium]